VSAVLHATLEALAEVGYGALRLEAVAAAAGVNKTTVYRRWPTKAALVRDALVFEVEGSLTAPDLGDLRSDLRALARGLRALLATPRGQTLARMMYARVEPELQAMCNQMREGDTLQLKGVIRRAVARGELPRGTDAELLLDLVLAPIQDWMLVIPERATDARIDALVDLVLRGAVLGSGNGTRPRGSRQAHAGRAGSSPGRAAPLPRRR
jgi:AcrR family transcriptional regulator